LTQECVKYIGWSLGLIYTVVVIISTIWIETTFPGYYDQNGTFYQYVVWYYATGAKLHQTANVAWSIMLFVSCLTAIYAICKIFATNKVLSHQKPNVKINKTSMVLHSLLLVIQTSLAILFQVSNKNPKLQTFVLFGVPIIDMTV
jgi:hypothetical protein